MTANEFYASLSGKRITFVGVGRSNLPLIEQFRSIGEFYSTAFHEITHSTGHCTRLNRLKATAHFGNAEYSKEELTAEIGAAALLNRIQRI